MLFYPCAWQQGAFPRHSTNSKLKLLSVIVFLCLIVLGLGTKITSLAHAQSLKKNAHSEVSIDFRTYAQDIKLQDAILSAINNRSTDSFPGNSFAVTSERRQDDWSLLSIASLNGPNCSLEFIGSGNCGTLIIAYKGEYGWHATLAGYELFSNYLNIAPEKFLTLKAKLYLDPLKVKSLPSDESDGVVYKFPWAPSEWEYRGGWHNSALDIGTHGSDIRVLAASDGVISDICVSPTGNSANVHIVDSSGKKLEYWHLNKSKLGWGIEMGREVFRGQILGDLLSGSWTWDGCGEAPDQTSAHIHWVIPLAAGESFTADGWTINYGDSTWRKGDQIRIPTFPYKTLPSTNKAVAAILYEHTNYQGHSLALYQSDEDLCDDPLDPSQPPVIPCFSAPSWNDVASSVWVAPGHQVWLYLHSKSQEQELGEYYIYRSCNTGIPDFSDPIWNFPNGVSLNDNVSRVIIEKCGPGSSANPAFPANGISIASINPCDPEPPPSLTDNASFISDITLPDGTVVSPGQALTKTWRVQNSGTSTWGSGYQLVFTSGEQMGAPSAVNVPVTAPGQEVDISVNITAPSEGGSHWGNWRLRNPQGTYFGDELLVEITVPDDSNPPPPPNDFTLSCLNCPASIPPGQTFRPTIRATVGSGQLLGSRGDSLRNTDGNLYGAWPHVAVVGTVNQGQTYDFTFYADNPITAPNSDGTYQTKWRLWQNGQYVGPELTIAFQVQSGGGGTNHPPNAPSLTGPGDWAVYYGNTGINLQAQNNGDPDGDAVNEYYFEIYESAQLANSGWISSNSWSPQGLGWNGYQWHVKVRDGRGAESGWSNTWHFNLINNEPTIYDFHSETCRASWGGSEKICFCAQTNAGTLQLQVNTATDGSGNGEWRVLNELGVPNYSCNTDNDSPPNWGQLEGESGTHLVRLYARREGGWANAATRDITVYLPPERRPNNPPLQQPINQAYLNSLAIHFDWNESLRTTGYHLEASTNPGFGTLLVDEQLAVGTTEYDYTLPTDYETVYWRVTATGPYGTNESTNSFYTDIAPPTSAVAALPPVTTDTKFSVNWSGSDARSGLRWYHVQVRDGNRSDSEWVDWLVNTTKIAELFSGQSGHVYYFRSRAMDKVGNWENWPTGDGDSYTLVDPSAAPPTAWWDNAYAAKRNLIILNSDGSNIPIHYPMRVHFDSSTSPTAAEVYNASLSSTKGDDVRIVYNNQTELDRFVQRFTSDQIDLWFPLYAVLGGGQADNSGYQIYYGYAGATSPTVDINDIFLPVADANTIGLWHFQDGTGSTVTDTSGRGHNGTFYSPGWNDGWWGWAGSFDGFNSYVDAGTSNDFNVGSGPMTIEAWIYMTQDRRDWPFIVAKWDNGSNGSYYLHLNGDDKIHWTVRSAGEVTVPGGNEILVNHWYHVAVTYDGINTMRIYLNGSERVSKTVSGAGLNSTDPLTIGWVPGVNLSRFIGYIQHVRISNVQRTSFPYAVVTNTPSVAVGTIIMPPISGSPDLAVLGLSSYPNTDGGALVQATIQNQGSANTLNGFYTDLYVDHLPTGAGDYTGSLRFWVNDPIGAGETVTLTTLVTNVSQLFPTAKTVQPGAESSVTLYAQTDSTGAVTEADNGNNIYTQGTTLCVANPDSFENDESPANASLITVGSSQSHNFHLPGDSDWIKFNAQAGKTYRLTTGTLGISADTYLYLYDVNGTTLISSNDDSNGSLASRIEWTAPANGIYYVLVQHWNPNVGGCGTQYNLTAQEGLLDLFLPLIMR